MLESTEPETGEFERLDPVTELEDATKEDTDPVAIGRKARNIWQRYPDGETRRRIGEAAKKIIKAKGLI